MTWRREDTGYAAAAAAAAFLVAFLVAGNFGLVPSLLSPGEFRDELPTVAAVQVASAANQPRVVDSPAVVRPPILPRPPAPPARDSASPKASFVTPDGAAFGIAEPAIVEGIANDAMSGIRRVVVVFQNDAGDRRTAVPTIKCSDRNRRGCSWSAEIPAALANYTVRAEAFDVVGNSKKATPIRVSVVNPAGPVKQVGETVQRVPGAVAQVLGSLLGVLGGG